MRSSRSAISFSNPVSNVDLTDVAAQLDKDITRITNEIRDIKKKIKLAEEKETLVPIEHYLKSSIHLGTRVITPDMKKYVYRRRADGLAVFNTARLVTTPLWKIIRW